MSHFKVACPHRQGTEQLRKHGRNRGQGGQARYFCTACERAFTPEAKSRGLPAAGKTIRLPSGGEYYIQFRQDLGESIEGPSRINITLYRDTAQLRRFESTQFSFW